jgi:hypothetical protein
MLRVSYKKFLELGIVIAGLSTLVLAGCGGGGSSPNSTGAVLSGTASQYFVKTATGNHWTVIGSDVNTNSGVPVTTNVSGTITNISFVGGVLTRSMATTTDGVPDSGSPYGYTLRIDPATGNLTNTNSSTLETITLLPATFSVGTSWIYRAASGVNAATPATIAAMNVSRTVPAGTFNDCIQINIGPFLSAGVTLTGTEYFSPSAGTTIEQSLSGTATNFTYSGGGKLQAGYVAN